MKRLILYDLDGTLVDTLEDIAHSANHMLTALGLPPIRRHDVRRYVGRGVYQLISDCLGTDDAKRIERGLKIYRAHYHEHMLDRSQLYPHAEDILKYFQARTQAVVTNKPNPYSQEILEGLGVAHYFFTIIAGDSPYPKKPDPTAVHAVMQMSGAAPSDTLFIGDSPIDVETGRKVGVTTVGITHGFAEDGELASAAPDVIVRDFKELLDMAMTNKW